MADLTYIEQKAVEKAARDDAGSMAATMPVPGPAASAFLDGPIQVGQWSVRKMVMSDWLILQKIKSGVMLNAAELDKPEAIMENHWTDQTNCELIWMFTHTPKEIRSALKAGVDAFCEQCVAETVDVMEIPADYTALCMAVMEQIQRANATILSHEDASKKEGGETHFFPGAERPSTDSAGTLTSSAA